MNAVRVKDLRTGNIGFFNKQGEALAWIRKLSKKETSLATVSLSIKLNRPRYKRFEITLMPKEKVEKEAKPMTHTKKVEGWDFWQGELTPTVLVAERRLKYYDNDRFQAVSEALNDLGYLTYFDTFKGENTGKKKTKARVEIYRKFDEDVSFEEKIELFLKTIDQTHPIGLGLTQ